MPEPLRDGGREAATATMPAAAVRISCNGIPGIFSVAHGDEESAASRVVAAIGRVLWIEAISVERIVHGLLNDPHFGLGFGPERRRKTHVSVLIGDAHHEPTVPTLNPVSGQCDDPIVGI